MKDPKNEDDVGLIRPEFVVVGVKGVKGRVRVEGLGAVRTTDGVGVESEVVEEEEAHC